MSWSKNEEEKAAKRAAKEQERQNEEFARSPQGLARMAAQRGDGYFEIELSLRSTGSTTVYIRGDYHGINTLGQDDLSLIESEGWFLVTVNHVFVPVSEDSRDIFMRSGQKTAIAGKLVGIYLFRRTAY